MEKLQVILLVLTGIALVYGLVLNIVKRKPQDKTTAFINACNNLKARIVNHPVIMLLKDRYRLKGQIQDIENDYKGKVNDEGIYKMRIQELYDVLNRKKEAHGLKVL